MPPVTRSGVVGAPSTATATAGQELFALLVGAFARLLTVAGAERDPVLE
jgi:creatinine amidohydrolase/Fe(II)-dependent formamide hydrolase-like protein